MQLMQRIILASASRERRKILKEAGFRFVVKPSKFREDLSLPLSPRSLVKYLALQKAGEVASRVGSGLVIGADTVVVFKGEVIGKPRGRAHARRILARLSGKTHSIITGFCIIDARTSRSLCRSVESRVTFRKLSAKEIRVYAAQGESLRAAGAYSIRESGKNLVRSVKGDRFNVAGIPLRALRRALREFKVH